MSDEAEAIGLRSVGPNTAEPTLLELAKIGNEASIREIVRRMNPRLFRIARGILDNDAEAEEVVQDTYLIVFSRIQEFRADSKLSTWVTKIALNAARMKLRKHHVQEEYNSVIESQYADAAIISFPNTKTNMPEREQGIRQFRVWAEAAVSNLPRNLRLVFVLKETEGMSMADIAEDLGISLMTVKMRLFRARRQLRSAFEQQMKGGFEDIYPFDGQRCASMADSVVELLQDMIRVPD